MESQEMLQRGLFRFQHSKLNQLFILFFQTLQHIFRLPYMIF